MNAMFFILSLVLQPSDNQAFAGLFDLLDSDGNGRVTADEISAAQKPYFVRALRVSDSNEDGALTREELSVATADPQRTKTSRTPTGNVGRVSSFDPTSMDRNNDGYISKEEIPAFLQQRFKRLLERSGGQKIAVADVKKYVDYAQSAAANTKGNKKKSTPGSAEKNSQRQPESTMQQRSNGGAFNSFFDRLDRDKNGKLNGSEIPDRLRAAMQQFDRNRDRAISKQEFGLMIQSKLRE